MIHIDRNRIPTPSILESPRAEHYRKQAIEFFSRLHAERAQERFRWNMSLLKELQEPLLELFYGKCAYCESVLGVSAHVEIDNFRPKQRAVNLDGKISPDHYWWLAYEWSNLYPSCPICNRMKGTRFPVEGPRAEPEGGRDGLEQEGRLLLDPCEDDPAEHLVFGEDGTVASGTVLSQVTIQVFALNRDELVKFRQKEYLRLSLKLDLLEDILKLGKRISLDASNVIELSLKDLTDPAKPYAGMRRQFIGQWLQSLSLDTRQRLEEQQPPTTIDEVTKVVRVVRSEKEQQEALEQFQTFQQSVESYSLEDREHEEGYFMRTRMIERIEIRNFRVIKDLTLEVGSSQDSRAPWLMLLGENGTGKSSVLHAVALALMGERYISKIGIEPTDVLRYRCKSGHVRVYLSGSTEPIELAFRRDPPNFEGRSEPPLLLLGYGSTRLLPRPGTEPQPGFKSAHVDNLFNPFVPLRDANAWLCRLSNNDFREIARALKSILSLEDQDRLTRSGRGSGCAVQARVFGHLLSLTQLSDGYQSILALTVDIMSTVQQFWTAMEVAEGIVLLDEIGVHLHPRWQMRIVNSLRDMFPRIQFLTTTHNPLCLRGLQDGEVVVMRRHGPGVAVLTDLPTIAGMRVDQLLTSEHYGLDSTLDPDLDRKFKEYYHLLAVRQPSQEQQDRIAELKVELDEYKVLGTTRRERLMLEAVDQQLAQEAEFLDPKKRQELEDETRRQVSDIWAQALKQSEV